MTMKKNDLIRRLYRDIALAWGHNETNPNLVDMGNGLYNRICLGDSYEHNAKDWLLMKKLCLELDEVLSQFLNKDLPLSSLTSRKWINKFFT